MSHRERKQRLSVEGPDIKLADLRWLVKETDGWDDNSRVNVTHYPGDQRDPAYSTVEVAGDERVSK